jgi:hypothetical protein
MGRPGHLLVLGTDRQPLVGVSDSLMAAKGPLGHGIKAGRIIDQVLLPALCIPYFEMVSDAKQHDLAFEFSEATETFRNKDPARPVHIDRFGLSEVKASKFSCLGIGSRRSIESLGQALKCSARVKPKGFIRPGRDKKAVRGTQLLSQSFWQGDTIFFIQGPRKTACKKHGNRSGC